MEVSRFASRELDIIPLEPGGRTKKQIQLIIRLEEEKRLIKQWD